MLLQAGHGITIFDKSTPGGLAGGFKFPEFSDTYLEKYYHHIFKSDGEVIHLIKEMGLEENLRWLPSRSGLFASGEIWPFGTPLDLLRFRPIRSVWQRLRMGINLVHIKRLKNCEHLDDITCQEFFASKGNSEGFECLWQPLLQQKFGKHMKNIPASFLWGRIQPRASSRRNGQEILGYLIGGFPRLIDEMIGSIVQRGGEVKGGEAIRTIIYGSPVTVETASCSDQFDKVIWTLPSYHMPDIIADFPRPHLTKTTGIEYIAVTCLVLVLKNRLGSYYWLNNLDSNLTFGGLIEHTQFVPSEVYGGRHILYVVNYLDPSSPLLDMESEALLKYHAASLRVVYRNRFEENEITSKFVFRDKDSCPLYNMGYHQKMPGYDAMVDNIHICNMEQIYPYDRNMNNCVVNTQKFLRKNRLV